MLALHVPLVQIPSDNQITAYKLLNRLNISLTLNLANSASLSLKSHSERGRLRMLAFNKHSPKSTPVLGGGENIIPESVLDHA